MDLKAPAPKGGKVGEKCSGHVVYGETKWIKWSVSPHRFDVMQIATAGPQIRWSARGR